MLLLAEAIQRQDRDELHLGSRAVSTSIAAESLRQIRCISYRGVCSAADARRLLNPGLLRHAPAIVSEGQQRFDALRGTSGRITAQNRVPEVYVALSCIAFTSNEYHIVTELPHSLRCCLKVLGGSVASRSILAYANCTGLCDALHAYGTAVSARDPTSRTPSSFAFVSQCCMVTLWALNAIRGFVVRESPAIRKHNE